MHKVEIIDHRKLDWSKFNSSDQTKFSNWELTFDLQVYQSWRLSNATPGIIFFGVFFNNELQAIIEFQSNNYETKLIGAKSATINQILFANNIEKDNCQELISFFLNFFNEYRKEENIKFCFIAVDNLDAMTMAAVQESGFRYMLTWGSCYYNLKRNNYLLPEGFYINFSKEVNNLEHYMAMVESYFKGGRFYLDNHFTKTQADQLYYDLAKSSYDSKDWQFATLFNSESIPVGYFIWKTIYYPFKPETKVAALRFLAMNRSISQKGLATEFLKAVSHILMQDHNMVTSGIEMHNLPSLKIHTNAGYRFNYVYSAFHSWFD